eukprot:Partr_v1_DN22450_c0_g2_i1_m32208
MTTTHQDLLYFLNTLDSIPQDLIDQLNKNPQATITRWMARSKEDWLRRRPDDGDDIYNHLHPSPQSSRYGSEPDMPLGMRKRKAVDEFDYKLFEMPSNDEIMEEDEPDSSTPQVIHVFDDLARKLNVNSRLMKRSCYIELRDILIAEKEKWDKQMELNLSRGMTCEIFLTGTPGIGKTSFLTWLIKALLRRGLQVIFGCREFKGKWAHMRYTKSNNGKRHLEMNNLDYIGYNLERDSTSWLICDSVEVNPFCGMTIFCSSPREDVSKQFRKRALELTMPIWTYDELVECRNLMYSNIIDIPYLRTRYFFLGGVPRLIFTNLNKNAVELIRDAVQTSSVEKLK